MSIDPTSSSSPAPKEPSSSGENKAGSFEYKPMTFLGMQFNADEAKKLWTVILQNVSLQIEKEKAHSLKALKKLKPGHEDD